MDPTGMYAWMTVGGGHELNLKSLEKFNVIVLKGSGFVEGAEIFCHSKKALANLADLKGLKFRTAGEGGAILERMGAQAIQLAGGEIYDALKRGVIDACEASGPNMNWSMAFQEVAPYLYLSPVRSPGLYCDLIFNKTAWQELPVDLKQIVESITRSESMRFYCEAVWKDAEALQKFKDYGNKVTILPKEIEAEMVKQASAFYDEMGAKNPAAAEVLKSQRDFRKKWEGYVSPQ
jgi:TRAP-type mannitol/chloroaromatic compound transport system substrate-binding protein